MTTPPPYQPQPPYEQQPPAQPDQPAQPYAATPAAGAPGYPPPAQPYAAAPAAGYPQAPYAAAPGVDPDIQANKIHAVLAYLGILILVPLLSGTYKTSRFARYHTNQALTLIIFSIGASIVFSILGGIGLAITWGLGVALFGLYGLVALAMWVLIIIGIVNAAGGKYKPLPVIGGKLNLLKM
ncbi:MAG: hypothetical protein LBR27_08405 [Bifidobacteriaceae bacterium]|jgi:uncharacterized membrane protein|nr:hypothetical protein [Bifidobacteriaceae bacterium]